MTVLFFSPHDGDSSGQLELSGSNPHAPRPAPRCGAVFPAWQSTKCNRAAGHKGVHRYTSPVDGKFIEWGPGWD